MARVVSLRCVRWSHMLRVGAACLIVLIVLPFTAPFASFDLADLLGDRAVGESAGSASEVKDVTDALTVAAPFSPQLTADTLHAAPLPCAGRLGALRTIVLRI